MRLKATRAFRALMVVAILPLNMAATQALAQERGEQEQRESKAREGGLNLTQAQQRRIQAIQESVVRQILQVLTPAQRQMLEMRGRGERHDDLYDAAGLTDDQRARIEAIHRELELQGRAIREDDTLGNEQKETRLWESRRAAEEQIHQILTPAQQEALQAARARQEDPFDGLGLTDDQRARIEAIHRELELGARAIRENASLGNEEKEAKLKEMSQAAEAQVHQILTPEQRRLLEERMKERSEAGEGEPYSMRRLETLGNLTKLQKNRIQAIYGRAESQFRQVLTREQRQKLASKAHEEHGEPR